MSFTIWNGFKIKVNSLDAVAMLAANLRVTAVETARLVIAKEVLNRAANILDLSCIDKSPQETLVSTDMKPDIAALRDAITSCKASLSLLSRSHSQANYSLPFHLADLKAKLEDIQFTLTRDDFLPKTNSKDSPLQNALRSVSSDILNALRNRSRLPSLDVLAELWVFRDQSDDCVNYYAMLNADNRDMYDAIAAHPALLPMPYSNASDMPPGISSEEWTERGNIWERLLGRSGVPADNCMTSQICSDYGLSLFSEDGGLSESRILSYLPKTDLSEARRSEHWARRQWRNDRFRVLSENTEGSLSGSQLFQICEDSYRADVTKEADHIRSLLPKITPEALLAKL